MDPVHWLSICNNLDPIYIQMTTRILVTMMMTIAIQRAMMTTIPILMAMTMTTVTALEMTMMTLMTVRVLYTFCNLVHSPLHIPWPNIQTIFVGQFVCSEYMMNLESIVDSVYIYTTN